LKKEPELLRYSFFTILALFNLMALFACWGAEITNDAGNYRGSLLVESTYYNQHMAPAQQAVVIINPANVQSDTVVVDTRPQGDHEPESPSFNYNSGIRDLETAIATYPTYAREPACGRGGAHTAGAMRGSAATGAPSSSSTTTTTNPLNNNNNNSGTGGGASETTTTSNTAAADNYSREHTGGRYSPSQLTPQQRERLEQHNWDLSVLYIDDLDVKMVSNHGSCLSKLPVADEV